MTVRLIFAVGTQVGYMSILRIRYSRVRRTPLPPVLHQERALSLLASPDSPGQLQRNAARPRLLASESSPGPAQLPDAGCPGTPPVR